MRILLLTLIILNFLSIMIMAQQENAWDIKMHFLNSEVMPGEPIYAELEAMNRSSIALPYWWHYLDSRYFTLDGKQCTYWEIEGQLDGGYMGARPKLFEPSRRLCQPGFSEIQTVYINKVCSITWVGRSKVDYGKHEFCYRWDEQHKACSIFIYKEPTGIDANAFALIKNGMGSPLNITESDRSFFPILRDYPTSLYAAWITYDDIYKPTYREAEKIVKLISENSYPRWNSVRDPNSTRENRGWTSIKAGKPMAAWAKEKSLFILKNHPDFVFSFRLKIIAAICDIVLGKEDEGIKQIQDLIQAEEDKIKASPSENLMSNDIQWAKKFLDAWQKKKTSLPSAPVSK